MNNVNINQINNFLSDKEKCAKVFKAFSTQKYNKSKYDEFIQTQKSFESSNSIPYFHC